MAVLDSSLFERNLNFFRIYLFPSEFFSELLFFHQFPSISIQHRLPISQTFYYQEGDGDEILSTKGVYTQSYVS